MLPGKTYTPKELLRIASRRSWLLIAGLMLGAAVALIISNALPDLYRSETLIMVEPQRIPTEYVKSIDSFGVDERLVTLEGQILSRSRLERIILDLDLYEPLRTSMPMEDVVQVMRGDNSLTVETKASFRVGYVSEHPETAQRVAESLSSLFIEETLKDREVLAEDTNGFFDSQLEEAKRQLIEH